MKNGDEKIYSDFLSQTFAGWWYSYPSEKYESQLEWLFPTEWKNKIHVPNHQIA